MSGRQVREIKLHVHFGSIHVLVDVMLSETLTLITSVTLGGGRFKTPHGVLMASRKLMV